MGWARVEKVEHEEWLLVGTGFLFGVMEMFRNWRWWLHNLENTLKNTKLYILKGCILWYMDYTSINTKKQNKTKAFRAGRLLPEQRNSLHSSLPAIPCPADFNLPPPRAYGTLPPAFSPLTMHTTATLRPPYHAPILSQCSGSQWLYLSEN